METKQFLQHVAYGQQIEAEGLLKSSPVIAQELLTARDIPFTDEAGRTFTCTAYEYAYWAGDSHMRRMLECYMLPETKRELLIRIDSMERLEGPGLFKKPYGLVYTQFGRQYRSAYFDLNELINAWTNHGTACEKSHHNKKPELNNLFKEEVDSTWSHIGDCQRNVPAHIAQEYCHPNRTFTDVAWHPALLDADYPENLPRQPNDPLPKACRIDTWFKDPKLFTISRSAYHKSGPRGSYYPSGDYSMEIIALRHINEARNKDREKSFEFLRTSPSVLPAPCPA